MGLHFRNNAEYTRHGIGRPRAGCDVVAADGDRDEPDLTGVGGDEGLSGLDLRLAGRGRADVGGCRGCVAVGVVHWARAATEDVVEREDRARRRPSATEVLQLESLCRGDNAGIPAGGAQVGRGWYPTEYESPSDR